MITPTECVCVSINEIGFMPSFWEIFTMLFCKRSSMTATSLLLLLLLSLFFVSPMMMMMKMTTTTTACVGDFKGDARARRCFSSEVSFVGGIRFLTQKKNRRTEEESLSLFCVCAYHREHGFCILCNHSKQIACALNSSTKRYFCARVFLSLSLCLFVCYVCLRRVYIIRPCLTRRRSRTSIAWRGETSLSPPFLLYRF